MKIILIATVAILASNAALADDYVNGYVRQDGTYVQPHFKTNSNSSMYDNYSTRGNTNPYTGQRGYVNPTPSYNTYSSPRNSSYSGNSGGRKSSYGY